MVGVSGHWYLGRAGRRLVLDIKARAGVGKIIAPLIKWLAKSWITPTYITITGLLIMVGGAVLIGYGYLMAGWIVATVEEPIEHDTIKIGPIMASIGWI